MAEAKARDLYKRYLDPKILDKIQRTELKARSIIEGFMMGLNKSPVRGFSVDFKQHREYVHGDDPRYMDWKVWGRSDRLMIKEFEQETNARVHLVLDASKSMKYGSKPENTKFDFAAKIIASLGFLGLQQRDWVTFTMFANQLIKEVPGSTSRNHIATMLNEIYSTTPDSETDLKTSLLYLSEKIKRRGIVILVSDLLDEPEHIAKGLSYLKAKRHDVIVAHVMDEYELTFPFKQLTRFQGMEELNLNRLTDPQAIRKEYLEALERFCSQVSRNCRGMQVDYLRIGTHEHLEGVLAAYLAHRQRATG